MISGGVAFSAVRSIDVDDVHGPGKDSEDSEAQKSLGTPMMMQVSMVRTVIRPMSSAEFEIAKLVFKQTMGDLKDLYKKGKDFYKDNEETFKRAKLAFKAMQGVGDIISGVKNFLPEEQDPMVQMLADLEANVKALSEKLTDNFAEMKNFISEQTFFTNIMSPTSVLTRLMRDCISHPGDSSKDNFRKAYQNVKPLRMQYVSLSLFKIWSCYEFELLENFLEHFLSLWKKFFGIDTDIRNHFVVDQNYWKNFWEG